MNPHSHTLLYNDGRVDYFGDEGGQRTFLFQVPSSKCRLEGQIDSLTRQIAGWAWSHDGQTKRIIMMVIEGTRQTE